MKRTAGWGEVRPAARTSIRMGPSDPGRVCFVRVGVAIAFTIAKSGDRRFQDLDFSGSCVESRLHTDGQGPLFGDVTKGKSVRHRNAQGKEVVGQDLIEAQRAIFSPFVHLGELAHYYAGQFIENTGQFEMGQHTVHPVQRLSHVFDEEKGTIEVRLVPGANHTLQQGEVTAEE